MVDQLDQNILNLEHKLALLKKERALRQKRTKTGAKTGTKLKQKPLKQKKLKPVKKMTAKPKQLPEKRQKSNPAKPAKFNQPPSDIDKYGRVLSIDGTHYVDLNALNGAANGFSPAAVFAYTYLFDGPTGRWYVGCRDKGRYADNAEYIAGAIAFAAEACNTGDKVYLFCRPQIGLPATGDAQVRYVKTENHFTVALPAKTKHAANFLYQVFAQSVYPYAIKQPEIINDGFYVID